MKTSPVSRRRRVRLVLDAVARREDRLLRHRRPGAHLRGRRDRRRGARAQGRQLDAAWVTALVARPDGTLVAGTTPGGRLYTVDPKKGEARPLRHAGDRPRLGAGARRQDGRRLRRHRRAREDLRRRPQRPQQGDLGLGRQARRVAAAGRRQAPLRRDQRGGDPVPGRARRPRRGAGRLRRRGGARAGPLGQRALRRGQRLRARRCRDRRAARPPRHGHAHHRLADRLARLGRRAAAARASASRRPRSTASIPTAAPSRSSPSATATSRRSPSTTTGGPTSAPAPRGASTASIPIARPRWPSTSPERQALTLLRSGQDVPGRHRRRGRHLPGGARAGAAGDLPLARARRRLPVALGAAALARHARARRGDPLGEHRQARRHLVGFADLDHPRATGDGGVGLVGSPTARYVQYRVTFGAPEARLGQVTLAYLPQNQRARVTEITVGDSGGRAALSTGGALGGLGGDARRPAATRAHSPIDQAALEGRQPRRRRARLPALLPRGERRRLAAAGRPRPAHQDRLRLEHRGAPRRDLRRARRRQRRALRAARARRSSRASTRRPSWSTTASPRWSGLAAKYPFVSGRARDDQSPLTSLEYAIDGGEWQILAPADGICDDLVEAFTRQAARRCRPARTPSPCAPGTAPTTWAPPP